MVSHITDFAECFFNRRKIYDDQGNDHFNQNITVVVNDRIDGGKRFRETFRHIVHPVQIPADGMEKAAKQTGDDITDSKPVLFCVPQTCNTKRGEGKKVVTACLERGQEITAAALDELKDAVGKCSQNSDADSVQVPDITNKKHAE